MGELGGQVKRGKPLMLKPNPRPISLNEMGRRLPSRHLHVDGADLDDVIFVQVADLAGVHASAVHECSVEAVQILDR